MTLMDRLDQISRMQGRETIDYSTIQGPPAPPEIGGGLPPRTPPQPEQNQDFEEEDEASPLVALGRTQAPTQAAPQPVPMPEFDLVIMDGGAAYKGQSVTLTGLEQASIAQIVLRAAARRVKEQYDALVKTSPKRVRVKRAKVEVTELVPVKKKRGRPRKNPLPTEAQSV